MDESAMKSEGRSNSEIWGKKTKSIADLRERTARMKLQQMRIGCPASSGTQCRLRAWLCPPQFNETTQAQRRRGARSGGTCHARSMLFVLPVARGALPPKASGCLLVGTRLSPDRLRLLFPYLPRMEFKMRSLPRHNTQLHLLPGPHSCYEIDGSEQWHQQ